MATETTGSSSALLVMDFQNGIVERIGNDPGLLGRVGGAIAAAREAEMPIIYVHVRFRAGYPEISPRNRSFSALKEGKMPMTESDLSTAIHPAVAPQAGDVVVTKRRVGAFSGSDLEVVLRAQGVTSLVLAGIATSGVVLSTLRLAADMDFEITVLSDCCADSDADVHDVLMTKVFPRQAEVLTLDEWQAKLPSRR
ncbi:MAG: cysteine hydrolase [Armatimonadota bacterium]|nr:cysteine hydrolase [Armatimonadota bacterium]